MNAGSYEEVIGSSACLIYGKLKQKRKTSTWNALRCAVWDKFFLCFKDENDKKPQVAFVLAGFQVSECVDTDEIHVFQLSKPGVVAHLFASESQELRSLWIAKLKQAGVQPTLEETDPGQQESRDATKTDTGENATDNAMADPYFSSIDIDSKNVPSLSTNDPAIHTSQSFDSIQRATGNAGETQLHRSEEIENLLNLNSESSSEEEFNFTPAKERGKSLLQEVFEALNLPEPLTDDAENTNDEAAQPTLDTTDGLIAAVSALNSFIKNTAQVDSEKDKVNVKLSQDNNDQNKCDDNLLSNKIPSEEHSEEKYSKENNDVIDGRDELNKLDESLEHKSKEINKFPTKQSSSTNRHVSVPPKSSPLVKGFVNVNFPPSTAWKQMWAVLELDHIDLGDSPNAVLKRKRIATRGLQIEPSGADTGRFLSFKLIRANNKLELKMEAKDDEDLGRWVSGLFRSIQHSNKASREVSHRPPPPTPAESLSTGTNSIADEEMNEVISVKNIRSVFETNKSKLSSSTATTSGRNFNYETMDQHSSSSIHDSPLASPTSFSDNIAPEELESNYERMKHKLESKYADVVCWLGRYIEQEEEKQVLSAMANPYLAKLRIRHKVEMAAQIDGAITNLEQTIESLRDKLALKTLKKDKKDINQGRLIRCAEDARRTTDELKRIDRETSVIKNEILQAQKRLDEMKEAAQDLQREIEIAYSEFDWERQNGRAQSAQDDNDSKRQVKGEPDWTKKAKEKAKAWRSASDDVK